MLEQCGIAITTPDNAAIRPGNLRARFDAILLPRGEGTIALLGFRRKTAA